MRVRGLMKQSDNPRWDQDTMSGPSDVSGAAAVVEEMKDGVILRVRVRPRARRDAGCSA